MLELATFIPCKIHGASKGKLASSSFPGRRWLIWNNFYVYFLKVWQPWKIKAFQQRFLIKTIDLKIHMVLSEHYSRNISIHYRPRCKFFKINFTVAFIQRNFSNGLIFQINKNNLINYYNCENLWVCVGAFEIWCVNNWISGIKYNTEDFPSSIWPIPSFY